MIRMSDSEVAEFLASQRVVTCATVGPRGWPHLMPLWYVLRVPGDGGPGPRLWAWTYAASQKVRNIERHPRATLQLEAGEAYAELRGVMLECEDPPAELPVEGRAMIEAQAPKRVGLEFVERRRASFDHRKLGGAY